MRGSDGDTRPKRPIAHNLSPHLSEWWLYWSNDHKIDTKAFDRSFDQSAATKTSSIYDCIGRSEVSPTIGINPSSSLICLCCDASTKTNHHCVFLTMGLIYVYALQGPIFLDAFSHLYKRLCPSVHPSFGPSIGRSHTNWNPAKVRFSTKITGSTSENASYAVYTALFQIVFRPLIVFYFK